MIRTLVLMALLALPGAANACSTCMDPREGNRTLLWVTIFLSLLPLGLLASIGGFFWYRARSAPTALASSPDLPPLENR